MIWGKRPCQRKELRSGFERQTFLLFFGINLIDFDLRNVFFIALSLICLNLFSWSWLSSLIFIGPLQCSFSQLGGNRRQDDILVSRHYQCSPDCWSSTLSSGIIICVNIIAVEFYHDHNKGHTATLSPTAQAMAMAIISPSMRNVTTPEAVLNPWDLVVISTFKLIVHNYQH